MTLAYINAIICIWVNIYGSCKREREILYKEEYLFGNWWKKYHRVARGYKNKKEEQEFERLFRKQYQDIQVSLEKKSVLEVDEEEQNVAKESTIRTNRYNLTKVHKDDQNRKINLTNHEYLQKIICDMESSGFSENNVSAVYYLLRKIFKFAIYKGYIQINPMDQVKMRVNSEKITKELSFWEPN